MAERVLPMSDERRRRLVRALRSAINEWAETETGLDAGIDAVVVPYGVELGVSLAVDPSLDGPTFELVRVSVQSAVTMSAPES